MPFSFTMFKIGLFLAWTIAAMVGTAWTTHKVDLSSYQKLELKYATAQAEAVEAARVEQKRLDNLANLDAQHEATTQAALADLARRQLRELQTHVQNHPTDCIRFGFVRVLDAKVHGVLAERLLLPAGKSDQSCTGLTSVALAQALGDILDAANANAEQLNALIAALQAGRG